MSNCREYESDIALEAGGDLEGEGRHRLKSHLKLCSRCQASLDRMKACLSPLAIVARDESDILDSRIWQSVSKALQSRHADQGMRQFNGWVAALATAALLLAAVGIAEQMSGAFSESGDTVAEGQFLFEGETPRADAVIVSDSVLLAPLPQDELEADDRFEAR